MGGRRALRDYLTEQHRLFATGDDALLDGVPDADAVHDVRVGLRRVRSVGRVFRVVPPTLDDELRWYAGVLGAVRDLDVLRAHLLDAVHALPPELVLGPVAADLTEQLQLDRTAAYEALVREHAGERHRALRRDLDRLVAALDPPADGAHQARKARRKAAARLRAATDDVSLHRARKAVKRARYADEVLGRDTARWKRVQDLLGEHQDSVVARGLLRRLALRPGVNAFTYGLLHDREERRAEAVRGSLPRA